VAKPTPYAPDAVTLTPYPLAVPGYGEPVTAAVTSQLRAVCLDCRAPAELASFWAAVLGYTMRPHSAEDLASLTAAGRTAETDPSVALDPPDGVIGPTFWLNEVSEPKAGKNRVHVDVYLDGETVDPLLELGASVLREPDGEIWWWVLADPEGNEFCAFRRSGR
jgi:Glyoxalase-like domain